VDEIRVRFKGKAFSVAIRLGASIEDDQAKEYFDTMYSDWTATGLGLDEAAEWLDARMATEFRSLGNPPEWVEDEPAWPFLNGRPMVFLMQCSFDDMEPIRSMLSPGETVYLFGIRSQVEGNFEMVYRTISQFEP
jgi:hypothetical protein